MTSTQQTAHSRQRGLLLIGLLTILSGPAQAAEETGVNPLLSAQATDVHPVTASLIAEHASIQPGGQTRIGVHFEMEEGWHIYAQDPGDAGLPTKVTWLAPDWIAVGFGPLQWPNAQEFLDPGNIRTFGYTGALVLYSTFTFIPKAGAKPGPFVPVQANVEWLACKDICLPGRAELKLTLPVDSKPPVFTPHAQLFEHTN